MGASLVLRYSVSTSRTNRPDAICHLPLAYTEPMPKLWNDTIDAHRRDVQEAILEATAALVSAKGLQAVTMSQIAEEAGIGRATLYKYYSDVESILVAWHKRHISAHLEHLAQVRDQAGDADERLASVLEAFALISFERRDTNLAAVLHRGEHVAHAERHLSEMIRELLDEAAKAGAIRRDVAAGELAAYCLHALAAASSLSSKAAVRRLVGVTLAGLKIR
ncbi:MAG: TetR/AcrR family transcriptional regulator [Myxococcales bacterium]